MMQKFSKDQKIILVTVGLPARGKTFICRKLTRYLTWNGYTCKSFQVENYRPDNMKQVKADFFDPMNELAHKMRTECTEKALQDIKEYLVNGGGDFAILDGTNYSVSRRASVKDFIEKNIKGSYIIYMECICVDKQLIEKNLSQNAFNPNYVGWDPAEATRDFKRKLEMYEKGYQQIRASEDIRYIKIFDMGRKFEVNKIHGYLQSKIISYIMNLNAATKPIYLSRNGETFFSIQNRIGGDSDLTEKGQTYSKKLNYFFQREFSTKEQREGLQIFTSTLKRAIQTAESLSLGVQPVQIKLLDEINAGVCDGLSIEEIAKKFPFVKEERNKDKLGFHYPRGESYIDLVQRIEPLIFEIERSQDPIIIVAHQAILRCIMAYLSSNEITEVPFLQIKEHTVFKIIADPYKVHEESYTLDVVHGDFDSIVNKVEYKDKRLEQL